MSLRTIATTAALGLATAGLVAVPTTAHADDDVKVRTGTGSMGAKYTYRLADRGDDPDRLRAVLKINSNKANRKWTVRIYRGDKLVHKATKRTGDRGNVKFAKTFRSDDDRRIKVVARAGYGEKIKRAMRLDD